MHCWDGMDGEGILFTHLQKCERVLLELLCHEPCRPLHRLSSSTVSAEPTGISCVGFPPFPFILSYPFPYRRALMPST